MHKNVNHLQDWMQLECNLLLAKIHYVMGDYKGALSKYNSMGLDTLSVNNITNRRLKLIGEAFAVKGWVLILVVTKIFYISSYLEAYKIDVNYLYCILLYIAFLLRCNMVHL